MSTQNLNICQVSLVGNIPVIKENYKNFCKFYDKLFFLLFVIFIFLMLKIELFLLEKNSISLGLYVVRNVKIINSNNIE